MLDAVHHAGRPAGPASSSLADGSNTLGAIADRDGTGSDQSESLAPAVTRAAMILEVMAEQPDSPVGASELARRLGLPKSSIANILNALSDAGLVRRSGSGFALGRKIAELGGA